jgi:hypothetical protein
MKKKEPKHPKNMTADEMIAHVFHPKAVEHLKEHVESLGIGKRKPSKKSDK